MSPGKEEWTLHKPYKAFLNIFTKMITIYRNVINNLNLHVLASKQLCHHTFSLISIFSSNLKKKRKKKIE